MIGILLVGFHLLSLVSRTAGSGPESDAQAKKFLLPGNLVPVHYDLRFNTHMGDFDEEEEQNFVYDGHVAIWALPKADNITEIVLQKNGLQVKKLTIVQPGEQPTSLRGVFNPNTQKFVFYCKFPLKRSKPVLLNVTFSGMHRGVPLGFYRSSYTANGTKMYILNSNFKATGARAAFPCFDEPKYKAVFKISVAVEKKFVEMGYRVLSNAPLDHIADEGENSVFYFKNTSAPLPTYLVSVLVSNYASTPPKYFSGVDGAYRKELRTWGPSANMSNSALVQNAGAAFLEMFAREFGVNYPLEKMDQVAIKGFPTGLENPGLVTYWELVLSESEAPEDVVTLVAHEMAHQWFGALVTAHSWSNIWLSEAFASYYEYFGTDKVQIPGVNSKEWNLPHRFVVACLQSQAFQIDLPGTSHPLTKDVYNPVDIIPYFDHISYDKGASVIRMWANALGQESFDKAVRAYLKKTQRGVASPKTLLKTFDEFLPQKHKFPGRPSELFRGWHEQAGYPVIQVEQTWKDEPVYYLSQSVFRYRKRGGAKKRSIPDADEQTWNIPITYSTNLDPRFGDTTPRLWIMEGGDSAKLTLQRKPKWIVVNNQVSGYYRVNYGVSNWRALHKTLVNPSTMNEIHEINRAQIIDDAANLARSVSHTYVSYNFFLDLTLYLKHERSYFPWKAALNNLQYLYNLLRKDDDVFAVFKKHVKVIMDDLYGEIKATKNSSASYNEKLLRTEITEWACKMDDYGCVELDAEDEGKTSGIHIDKRTEGDGGGSDEEKVLTLCSALQNDADGNLWNNLWEEYVDADDLMTRMNYIKVLSCTENESNVNKLLGRYIEDSKSITLHERKMIMISLFKARDKNINIIMEFLYANINAVATTFKGEDVFGELLLYMAKGMGTECEVYQMKQLIQAVQEKVIRRSRIPAQKIRKIVDTVEMNHEWILERQTEVYDWLASRYRSEEES